MPPESSPGRPSEPLTELLPSLHLSARTIAGTAQLLLLEMPELLPGMTLAPPAEPDNLPMQPAQMAREAEAWVCKVLNRIGLRCGHSSEYHFAHSLFPSFSLPEWDAITAADLAADLERRLREWGPQSPHWNEYNSVDVAALHPGALSDAVCTTLSLLVLAGEVVADEEANTFQRVYPIGRTVLLEEAVDAIRRFLSARYGPAVTEVRALGYRYNLGRIRVEHDGSLSDDEVTQLRGLLQQYRGTSDFGAPNAKTGWLATLFPDGSATRLRPFDVDPPVPRLRREDVPEGGELVWFRIRQVSLGQRPTP